MPIIYCLRAYNSLKWKGVCMKKEKLSGAEKLFSQMIDREYAEMADVPEDQIWEEDIDSIFDPEEQIDETKDIEIKGR